MKKSERESRIEKFMEDIHKKVICLVLSGVVLGLGAFAIYKGKEREEPKIKKANCEMQRFVPYIPETMKYY